MDAIAVTSQAETGHVPAREVLRARIIDLAAEGRIVPGELTSENAVAEMLGEGRTPVREALALLAGEGLFEQVPQKGIRLRPITREDAEAVLGLRARVETLVVETLARRDDRQTRLARPAEALKALSVAALKDARRFASAYAVFHVALAVGAGYRTAAFSLRSYLDVLCLFEAEQDRAHAAVTEAVVVRAAMRSKRADVVLSDEGVTPSGPRETQRLQILMEEVAVIEAVKHGHADAAGKAMARHLRESLKRLVPSRRAVRAPQRTEELLLTTAGYFERVRAHEATNLAVARLADVCALRGHYTQAARILGSHYVGIDPTGEPESGIVRFVRHVLGSKFERAVALGNRLKNVDDLQELLNNEETTRGSGR